MGFSYNEAARDNWTELNYPDDLTQFILNTKSQTLKNLENYLKKFH